MNEATEHAINDIKEANNWQHVFSDPLTPDNVEDYIQTLIMEQADCWSSVYTLKDVEWEIVKSNVYTH